MTTQLEAADGARRPTDSNSRSTYRSISKGDWEQFSSENTTSGETKDDELTINSNIYGSKQADPDAAHASNGTGGDGTTSSAPNDVVGPLDSVTTHLKQDVAALKTEQKGSQAYDSTLNLLTKDEAALKADVFGFLHSSAQSSDYQSFADTMQSYHSDLKSVATDLWDMGLKDQASETTAYFPLSHYEKYFGPDAPPEPTPSPEPAPPSPEPTPPPGANPSPPEGATEISNLSTANQKSDVNPVDIGGTGNAQSISVTQTGADQDEITMTGKSDSSSYGDGLLLDSVHNSTTDQNVGQTLQLNKNFSFTQAQLDNLNEYENDIVNSDGVHGTQINVHTGEVDAWNAADSKWQDVGSFGGPLVAGKTYSLQIDAQDNANGTMSYTGYYLNGQNVIGSPATYGDKPLGWAPGDYIQTQLDFLGNLPGNSVTGVSESGETLYVKNNS